MSMSIYGFIIVIFLITMFALQAFSYTKKHLKTIVSLPYLQ